jgi:hypothetical protein
MLQSQARYAELARLEREGNMNMGGGSQQASGREADREAIVVPASDKYAAALLLLAILVPPVAAVISIALYVVPWPRDVFWPSALAVPIGILVTGVAWAIGALILQSSCTAQRRDPDTYGTLLGRLQTLEAQAGLTEPAADSPRSTPPSPPPSLATPPPAAASIEGVTTDAVTPTLTPHDDCGSPALRELARSSGSIRHAFNQSGMSWVLASGYVHVWTLLHCMDEALIAFEPREALIRDALLDEARLSGSTMDNRDDLLEQLRLAVYHLGPDAAQYLAKQPAIRVPCPPVICLAVATR